MWDKKIDLILASASKIRLKLLKNAGLNPRCHAVDLDEEALKKQYLNDHFSPEKICRLLAKAKAEAIMPENNKGMILGCDQILVCENAIFNKPKNRSETRKTLQKLSGKNHHLISSACLISEQKVYAELNDVASLTMHPLHTRDIENYLDRAGENVMESVGGYHFEGIGIRLFKEVEGDYFTILGLPLIQILNALKNFEAGIINKVH